jgi:signal recognition particle receptor subunit beta
MALFNYATKEITLKIVYYGPGLSGKTTNLQQLYTILDPSKRGKFLSLATETDRTLFFDFLPVDLGKIKDFTIRFQLYTVPGQVKYNATRKVVLKGADAVVFVADSQREMREANLESFVNMRENLTSNNINPDDIPILLQYNKRDLPDILLIDELNKDLNIAGQVYLEAEAINGKGVHETFQIITKLLIRDIAQKHKLEIQPAVPPPEAEAVSLSPPEVEETFPTEEIPQFLSYPELSPSVEEIFPVEEGFHISKYPESSLIEEPPPVDESEKFSTLVQPNIEETFSIEEIQQPSSMPEQKQAFEETIIPEEPVQPSVSRLETEKEEIQKTIIKEVPVFPIEKIEKMETSLRETSQLFISTKVEMKRIAEDVKKIKEDQKEILDFLLKLNEVLEAERKKKKGWFS